MQSDSDSEPRRRARELVDLLVQAGEKHPETQAALRDAEATGLDPHELVGYALDQKVLQMVAPLLLALASDKLLPFQHKRMIEFYWLGMRRRNERLVEELVSVLDLLTSAGVKCVPVKGSVLLATVYSDDIGVRSLDDIDLLVSPGERTKAAKVLIAEGYVEGTYDRGSDAIRPLQRVHRLGRLLYLGNLGPFIRLVEDRYLRAVRVDLSYDVFGGHGGPADATDRLIDAARRTELFGAECWLLDEIDFLLHIAIHSRKEATNPRWTGAGSARRLSQVADFAAWLDASLDIAQIPTVLARAETLGARDALADLLASFSRSRPAVADKLMRLRQGLEVG